MSYPPAATILTLAGHDPSGGAGIQADIEAITANGCAAASVITCLTVQDTRDVQELIPLDPGLVERQARTLLADIRVQAIKIGLIGDAAIARSLARVLADHPEIPVVLDPVLAAGGGSEMAGTQLLEAIRSELLPYTTLLTPNSMEARRLGGSEMLEACAATLLEQGCGAVLITGTHEASPDVVNHLYRPGRETLASSWPRLPGSYHGSGCTLAAAIAAGLGQEQPLEAAVTRALEYTWNCLSRGYSPGHGQRLPDRMFTCRQQGEST